MRTFTASCSHYPSSTVFIFDIQRFNQEKTEEATPKRREEARKKGQVAKSVELGSALCLLAAFFALKLTGPYIYEQLTGYMQFLFSRFTTEDMTITSAYRFFLDLVLVFLKTVLPIMLVILAVSLTVNFLQVGFTFSLEPLMPQLSRINPAAGLQRLFSKRALVELVKSLLKVAIVSYFIYQFIIEETLNVAYLSRLDLRDAFSAIAALTLDLAFRIGAVILVLAILDYYYQWWEHNQNLKMTKQEVKEEFKQTEGNPQIKGKIKERQRALAMRRMMQEVPKADVVVTNPTHFAIALLYEKAMTAPMVIAKGQDFMAEKIKLIAKENGVAVVENKPLARALYDSVEIGETVPPELYQAVAEVLAYVYRLKKRLS
nr:flagellar biosynthesis protein FlhB [Sporolituus thermophilus]